MLGELLLEVVDVEAVVTALVQDAEDLASSPFTSSPPYSAFLPTSVLPANSAVLLAATRDSSPPWATAGPAAGAEHQRHALGDEVVLEHEAARLLVAALNGGIEAPRTASSPPPRRRRRAATSRQPRTEHELVLDLAAPRLERVRVHRVGVDDGVALFENPPVSGSGRGSQGCGLSCFTSAYSTTTLIVSLVTPWAVSPPLSAPSFHGTTQRGAARLGNAICLRLGVTVGVLLRGRGVHAGVHAARLRLGRAADRPDQRRRRQRPREQRDRGASACTSSRTTSHVRSPRRICSVIRSGAKYQGRGGGLQVTPAVECARTGTDEGRAMTMPSGIGAVDLMISFPKADAARTYDYLRATTAGRRRHHRGVPRRLHVQGRAQPARRGRRRDCHHPRARWTSGASPSAWSASAPTDRPRPEGAPGPVRRAASRSTPTTSPARSAASAPPRRSTTSRPSPRSLPGATRRCR